MRAEPVRGQPTYCTAIHTFTAFVNFPGGSIYDVAKHKGEQILICLLKGVGGK